MEKTILSSFQKTALLEFKKTSLASKFYLLGGTALSEFYLKHRLSEDLDFFTKDELNEDELKRFIKLVAKKTGAEAIEFQKGFGLIAFFLKIGEVKNKIDFGQYPFENVENLKDFDGLKVETMYDIALNKAHTIAFRPRLRDFVDMYFILEKKTEWDFLELLIKSFEKFEMKADALQVSENLLTVRKLEDMPVMIKKIDRKRMEDFFVGEIKRLEGEVWRY